MIVKYETIVYLFSKLNICRSQSFDKMVPYNSYGKCFSHVRLTKSFQNENDTALLVLSFILDKQKAKQDTKYTHTMLLITLVKD